MTTIGIAKAAHVGISVSDLDRSVAFYRVLTGVEPSAHGDMNSVRFGHSQGLSNAVLRYATINLENVGLDLIQFTDPKGNRRATSSSVPATRSKPARSRPTPPSAPKLRTSTIPMAPTSRSSPRKVASRTKSNTPGFGAMRRGSGAVKVFMHTLIE